MGCKMTPRMQNIMRNAETMLGDVNQGTIGAEHVMIAILDDPRALPTQILARFVDPLRVQRELRAYVVSDEYQQAGGGTPAT